MFTGQSEIYLSNGTFKMEKIKFGNYELCLNVFKK